MLDSVNASRRVVCDQCAIRAQIDAIARSPQWSQLGGPLPGHAAGRWVGHRLQMAFSMFGARSGPVTCGPGWPVPDRQTRNEDQPFLTRSESWGRGESPVAAYAHGPKLSRQGRPLLTFPRADPFFWILDCPLHFSGCQHLGHSLGCHGASFWRRSTSEVWNVPRPGRSLPPTGS